ncbi:MAG: sulfite exporter TauE/SafE family protein [Cyanobacteriota bacterium]
MAGDLWLLPVAVLVATVAMASGIEGGTLFTPLFLLVLRLPAQQAAAAGLITEVFGFTSGLIAYQRRQLIDWALVRSLLPATLPTALLASLASGVLPAAALEALLAGVLLMVAISFLRTVPPAEPGERPVPWGGEWIDRLLLGLGALSLGAVSAGLGEMNAYVLLRRRCLEAGPAVASGVAVVAISAQAAAAATLIRLWRSPEPLLSGVLPVVVFTVPGVLIGAQLGAWLAGNLPRLWLERGVAGVLVLVAATLGLQLLVPLTLR